MKRLLTTLAALIITVRHSGTRAYAMVPRTRSAHLTRR